MRAWSRGDRGKKLGLSAAALFGVASSLFGPSASATNSAPQQFQVSVNFAAQCTFTESWLTFPNYTTNSAVNVTGSTTFQVACPGVSAGAPHTVQFAFGPGTGTSFAMSNGVNSLNYQLCADSGCASPYTWNTNGPNISITSYPQNVTFYGVIPKNQSVSLGSYAQDVTATMTF
jgi:spore coat protein U-like protein